MSTVSDTGLYYPYANFRSDTWIKAAVLHWPLVGRIVPIGDRAWSLNDSDTVRELRDELGVIVDVFPGREAEEAEWAFFTVLDRNAAELRGRFGLHGRALRSLRHGSTPRSLDPQLDAVHGSKMTYRLAQQLDEAGLLREASSGWTTASGRHLGFFDYVMHRKLAGVYMALLADRTAEANKMIPVTDQPDMHASMAGWEPESLAHMLLDDPTDTPPPTADEIGQAFAVMAFRTVVPHDLEHVPVPHIVEARKRLQPQLLEYRAYLKSLSEFFAEIAEIPDANVREAQLRLKVEVEITSRVEKMQGEITRLGLKPAHAVLNLQTLAPPTVIGALTTAAGVPSPVTGVAVAAGCVAGAAISALRQRNEARQDHAVGYLMSVNSKLSPTDTVQKVRSILRRANPAAHRHGLDAPRRSPEL